MKLANILHPTAIIPTLQSSRNDEVLVELAECIHCAYPEDAPSAASIAERLLEREQMGSTGVGEGLAIPHCRMPHLKQTLAALGISREGVAHGDSSEEPPVRLFVALVSPVQSIGEHLRVLARVCRLFKSTSLLVEILERSSAEGIYEAIVVFEKQLESLR